MHEWKLEKAQRKLKMARYRAELNGIELKIDYAHCNEVITIIIVGKYENNYFLYRDFDKKS